MILQRYRVIFWITIGIVLISGITSAKTDPETSKPVLTATLDKDAARVGEMVTLTLKVQMPEGAHIPENPKIKGFEELTVVDQTIESGQIRIRFLVDRLERWESKSISLAYLDKEGREQMVQAEPFSIAVLSNLGQKPEEAELKPLQDIIPTERKWTTYLFWAIIFTALITCMVGLTWWCRKRHPKTMLPEIIDPPHIRAQKEIHQLQSQGLYETGKVKNFYFILSEILRRYMESIRHFPAAEYTTEEITCRIGNNSQDRIILPLLRQADLVKFAEAVPTPARKEDDVRTALAYIQETAPGKEEDRSSPVLRETRG